MKLTSITAFIPQSIPPNLDCLQIRKRRNMLFNSPLMQQYVGRRRLAILNLHHCPFHRLLVFFKTGKHQVSMMLGFLNNLDPSINCVLTVCRDGVEVFRQGLKFRPPFVLLVDD